MSRLQSPYAVAAVVALFYLALLAWLWGHFNGNPLGFVHIGTVFSNGDPNGTRGYDGQFYYFTAVDPLHAAQHMDNAAFRLQRVFYPLLIMAVSFGQAAVVPYAMIAITYVSIVGGTLLVALLLARWGRSPWFALGYGLCSGMAVALTFVTAEPLAFALVALGVLLWDIAGPRRGGASDVQQSDGQAVRTEGVSRSRRAFWLLMAGGTLSFAAALLTRELALYFAGAYVAVAAYVIGKEALLGLLKGGAALGEGLRRGLGLEGARLVGSVLAFVPLLAWSTYLSVTAGYLGVSFAQPFEHIPFIAYWLQIFPLNLRSVGYAGQYAIPAAVFGLLALWQLARTWRWPSPLAIALLGNVQLMVFLPRLGYQHQVAVSRYFLGFALAAVLWAATAKPRWVLWLTLMCVVSLLAFFYGLVRLDPAYLW